MQSHLITYAHSCRALLDLPPSEFKDAQALLHGSRCVFVGSGFAEAPKVAFQVISVEIWIQERVLVFDA